MKAKYYSLKNIAKIVCGTIIMFGASSYSPAPQGGDEKITICHIPPGNNQNRQTITISRNALQAHLDHGDFIGDCSEDNDGGDYGGSTLWWTGD